MPRHSNTERTGILKFQLTVENELNWVAREQSVSDVGIDLTIEQSLNGNPTGKFIAVQVKSGDGSLYESSDHFTLYFSNVHYNYWLGLEFPIILVFYSPKTDCLYWELINKYTAKRTNHQWKLVIFKGKKFNHHSFNELNQMIHDHSRKKDYIDDSNEDQDNIESISADSDYITLAEDSVKNILGYVEQFGEQLGSINDSLQMEIESGSNIKSPKPKHLLKRLVSVINIFSTRIFNEIDFYAPTYSKGISSFKKLTLLYIVIHQKKTEEFNYAYDTIKRYPKSFHDAINGIEGLNMTLQGFPNASNSKLKQALKSGVNCLNILRDEFEISKQISEDFIAIVDDELKGLN